MSKIPPEVIELGLAHRQAFPTIIHASHSLLFDTAMRVPARINAVPWKYTRQAQ
jgi:hypothetical protein